ncbi:MAG TPA: hypothetical protein VL334_21270 [Anaerolineae bacterium]|nr:hypothetical protein [Anaerolineae bacterium]
MSEEKNHGTPVANPGGSNQAPEDALADKLAEQADAVTSGLRDLLPDSKAIGIEEARPVATEVETALPSDETRGEPRVTDEPAAAASMPTEPTVESADGGKSESAAAGEAASAAIGAQVESSSDDRLMSALAWLTLVLLQLPIVSVIQLLSPTTKDRPFQRNHAITSLLFFAAAMVYEVVAVIVYTILGALTLGCGYACLWVIFFLPHALGLYYALQAYNGKTIELPVLSNFGRQQDWM